MNSNTGNTFERTLAWRTSSASMDTGGCVEVAPADGRMLVRDSKNRVPGQMLSFDLPCWRSLVTGL